MDTLAVSVTPKSLTRSQIEDLRLAASKMDGVERRNFQATIALKYCQGSARLAETVFSWGRQNVELGLAEKRTGISCVGLQSAFSGAKRWEEKQPLVALSLLQGKRILFTNKNLKEFQNDIDNCKICENHKQNTSIIDCK